MLCYLIPSYMSYLTKGLYCCIAVIMNDKDKKDKPRMKKLTIQVPADLHADVKLMATLMNTSMRSIIVGDLERRSKFLRMFADYSRSLEDESKTKAFDDLHSFINEDMSERLGFFRDFVDRSAEKGRDISRIFNDYLSSAK